MGTVFSFAFGVRVSPEVLRAVEDELDRIDRAFSPFRPESETSRLARAGTTDGCSPDMVEVLRLCAEATASTDGYFDAFHSGRFDPTGLVKGWAVRRIGAQLAAAGCIRHVINGGGDVLVAADPERDEPWRIGVPGAPGRLVATLRAHNLAVATSGNAQRPGEVVNPRTGRPSTRVRTLTVAGPDIVTADAFATAAVARGAGDPAWFTRLPGYRVVAQVNLSSAACNDVR